MKLKSKSIQISCDGGAATGKSTGATAKAGSAGKARLISNASNENRRAMTPEQSLTSLPFIRQFRIADPHWFDSQTWPHLHQWLQGFLTSARFASVMEKYSPWQPGEDGVTFPMIG